jgi:hypothetical protein
VRQRGNRFGFGFETASHLGIRGDMCRHDLDRDLAIEPQIPRAIHLAHAARSQPGHDFILSETLAWGE